MRSQNPAGLADSLSWLFGEEWLGFMCPSDDFIEVVQFWSFEYGLSGQHGACVSVNEREGAAGPVN